ncbi:MAG: redoxin family protein, partial [Chitinophagales bacterium]
NSVKISGTVQNPESEVVILRYFPIFGEAITDSFKLDEAGTFSGTIKLNEETLYTFNHGREYANIYLTPQDDITIKLDATDFDKSLIYEGKGAKANNFLQSKILTEAQLLPEFEELYRLPYEEFVENLKDWKDKLQTDFSIIENPSPAFTKMAQADIDFDWASKQLMYPRYYRYFTKNEEAPMDMVNYNFLGKLDMTDTDLLKSPKFRDFVSQYSQHIMEQKLEKDESAAGTKRIGRYLLDYATIGELFNNKVIQDFAKTQLMSNLVRYEGIIAGTDSLMNVYEGEVKNADYIAHVQSDYKKWESIREGATAPDFTTETVEGTPKKLSDFQGQYVYIDVWATWCGPCRKEIPHLEDLQAEYSDKNIAFVSVSIDETRDPWAKMVMEKEMKGNQLYTEGAWNASITQDYNIRGIPRFMLIGTDGKIIDANAPRPSGDIKNVLEELSI